MFIPEHFRIANREEIEKFIADHPFATLITASQGEIAVSHLPICRFSDGKYYGHMARLNAQADISETDPAYVIFSGPHAYITPAWYASEVNLPTWNFSAVHCRGKVAFIDSPEKAWSLLKEMVAILEGQTGWRLTEGHGHRRLIPHIRFFEFLPERIDAQFKFSQNKRSDDIAAIIDGLKGSGQENTAEFMAHVNRSVS